MKCHMLHNDRLFPEGAHGIVFITTLCGEATGTWHGATSHLETAAAQPHVHGQSQICLLSIHGLRTADTPPAYFLGGMDEDTEEGWYLHL